MKKFLVFAAVLIFQTAFVFAADAEKVRQAQQGYLDTVRVSWWGYSPEDNTAFLRAALNSKAKTIIIDKMAGPWITDPLTIHSDKEIILEEGAEILAKKGSFHKITDSLFYISCVKNVTIRGEGKGAVLRMRKADYHTDAYKKSEWRHGLNIKSSENITVENISIISTGGDGIYLGTAKKGVTNKNIRISNVICDDNNRQGISVITAENLLIENTVMKNTVGTAPESGIDFEPNTNSEKLVNCVLKNCLCENNAGDAYQFYLPNLDRSSGPASIVLDNCVSKNNKRYGLFLAVGNGETQTLEGSFTVKNCRFEKDNSMIIVRGKSVDGMDLRFENVELFTKEDQELKKPVSPIIVSSKANDENSLGKMTFKNITVHYNGNEPVIKFIDSTLNGYGISEVNGEIIQIKNGTKLLTVLNDQWCKKNYPTVNFRRIPAVVPEKCAQIPFGTGALKDSAIQMRNKAEYLLYAEKGQKIAVTWIQIPVGRTEASDHPAVLTSPSGKTVNFSSVKKFKEENKIEYTAKESGIHTLLLSLRTHAAVLTECSVPVSICCHPYTSFVHWRGTCSFYVPENTKEFALRIVGEGAEKVKVTVYDPNGKKYWEKDNIEETILCYSEEGKTPLAGVWTLKTDRPSVGVLEDFHLSLRGIPPYFFCGPEILLIPQNSTKK